MTMLDEFRSAARCTNMTELTDAQLKNSIAKGEIVLEYLKNLDGYELAIRSLRRDLEPLYGWAIAREFK